VQGGTQFFMQAWAFAAIMRQVSGFCSAKKGVVAQSYIGQNVVSTL
jgi:hypothetical protein